jgi:hypothetical protein
MSLATLQAHAHLNLLSIKGIIYDVSAQAQVCKVKLPGAMRACLSLNVQRRWEVILSLFSSSLTV